MFLATASVKRPVAMSALIIGFTLLGIYSFFKMGLELMPKIDMPYVTIITVYPGASPEQIETDIAKRIEDKMMTVEGLKNISSTCMENVCQTLLEFNIGSNVDVAATDVREKLDLVKPDLPEDAEDPKVLKFDINATPIANLTLSGSAGLEKLYDYADNKLRDRLTVVSGVADAELIGGAKREIQILLDRNKLAARGLSSLEIVQTIRAAAKTIPMGRIRDRGKEISVEFSGDFAKIDNLNELEILNKNDGKIIYLKDVASVKMGTEELRQVSYLNSKAAITIKIIKRSDANAVKVVAELKETIARIRPTLPAGMELTWVSDDARFIQSNADSAWTNIFQGILLTALILFLFLYNFKTLLITALTMPLNIVIGFFFMQTMNFTLNLSTLIAIGMSVGILVTNALVVLESIMKKLEENDDPKQAAIDGTSACTIEVLASSGTNIVVLFPIAQMGGVIGLFLRPLAMTMLIMTAVSLFVSFTVIPMLSSLLLKKNKGNAGFLNKIEKAFNTGLQWVTNKYTGILELAQKNRMIGAAIVLGAIIMLLQAVSLAPIIGGGFFPDADMANVTIKLEFPTSYSLNKTRGRMLEAIEIAKTLPEVKSVLANIGKVSGRMGGSSEGVYLAEIKLRLTDKDERSIGLDKILVLATEKFKNFTDAIVGISIPSPTGGVSAPVQMEISGDDLEKLDEIVLQLKEKTETTTGFTSVDTSVRPGKQKIKINPRRNVLSEASIQAVSLGTSLRGNIEGLKAATFKKGDRNYDIVVKFSEQEGSKQVEEFSFKGKDGKTIPLSNFGEIEHVMAPIQIVRKNKQRISRFESNLTSSLPLGNAISKLKEIVKNNDLLPAGYQLTPRGNAEMMEEAQLNLLEAAVISIVLVILTLAAIMESFLQPALILMTVPPTLIGILWSLYLTGNSISIFVIMGGVMLIGIVVNNAILILDHFNHLVKEQNIPKSKAIIQAAGDRFRPVIMITLAAVLGMLPMAFGTGIGAELRNDVGIASAGGILSSGIISLFLIPIIYGFFLKREKESPKDQGKEN